MPSKLSGFLTLTKPTIMLLVLITGATGLVLEGSTLSEPLSFLLILFGLYCVGGGANAFNQVFERNIDAKMTRTRQRRPLPSGVLNVIEALIFTIIISILGVFIFAYYFNILSGLLALATIIYYSFFYTLLLKPSTPYNIVIGGAAGSMAPVIAWAAASGTLTITPWILFGIVFFWTPPHFWALALYYKDDYEKAQLPMMPNIKGEDITLNQILIHGSILFVVSCSLFLAHSGLLYLVSSLILGSLFLKKSFDAKKSKNRTEYWSLFKYSVLHLFILFTVMIIDNILQ